MLVNDADQLSEAQQAGPKNMLEDLPDTFNEAQLEALRTSLDKRRRVPNGSCAWLHRGFITYSNQTGLYTKTEEYLKDV